MEAVAVVDLAGVRVVRDGTVILDGIDWVVRAGERWVVVGPNGSGKTTLLLVAAARLTPTSGAVRVLGQRLGRADWRAVREQVGFTSGALARQLRPGLPVLDVVCCGLHGTLEPWWHRYDEADRARATARLADLGVAHLAGRAFGVCSEGERQLVLLARELVADPALVVLDEPFAGLDLGHRERLRHRLARLAVAPGTPPLVLVTHHLEEIPAGFTHGLVLRDGRAVASGPLATVLTSATLSAAYGMPLDVEGGDGRWWARARHQPR